MEENLFLNSNAFEDLARSSSPRRIVAMLSEHPSIQYEAYFPDMFLRVLEKTISINTGQSSCALLSSRLVSLLHFLLQEIFTIFSTSDISNSTKLAMLTCISSKVVGEIAQSPEFSKAIYNQLIFQPNPELDLQVYKALHGSKSLADLNQDLLNKVASFCDDVCLENFLLVNSYIRSSLEGMQFHTLRLVFLSQKSVTITRMYAVQQLNGRRFIEKCSFNEALQVISSVSRHVNRIVISDRKSFFSAFLGCFPNLRSVEFEYQILSRARTWNILHQISSQIEHLSLIFDRKNTDPKSMNHHLKWLRSLKLYSLRIRTGSSPWTSIPEEFLQFQSDIYQSCSFENLECFENYCIPEGAVLRRENMLLILEKSKNLKQIDLLQSNPICIPDLECIPKNAPLLEKFFLMKSSFRYEEDASSFLQSFLDYCPRLEALRIEGGLFFSTTATDRLVTGNHKLKSIHLSKVDPLHPQRIYHCLKIHTQIVELNLRYYWRGRLVSTQEDVQKLLKFLRYHRRSTEKIEQFSKRFDEPPQKRFRSSASKH